MRTGKSKKGRIGILLLLPIFLLYVNHSLLIYHSHIFPNGVVITHSNALNDCEREFPLQANHPAKKQIIVFQGLMLVLNDNPLPVFTIENESEIFVKVSSPLIQLKCAGFLRHKFGRAPPAFLS